MTIVESISDSASACANRPGFQHDTLTLTWEERRRGHGRRRTDSGTEFAISLPSGALLKENDCLVLESERTIVTVRESFEPVYVIRPQRPQDWAFYAYHVGNRHQPVMIADSELIFLRTPAVKSLLEHLRVPYSESERPFTAALANPGHQP